MYLWESQLRVHYFVRVSKYALKRIARGIYFAKPVGTRIIRTQRSDLRPRKHDITKLMSCFILSIHIYYKINLEHNYKTITMWHKMYNQYDFLNPLSANPQNGQTHSDNSLANCRRIAWVCLTILWGWCLKC